MEFCHHTMHITCASAPPPSTVEPSDEVSEVMLPEFLYQGLPNGNSSHSILSLYVGSILPIRRVSIIYSPKSRNCRVSCLPVQSPLQAGVCLLNPCLVRTIILLLNLAGPVCCWMPTRSKLDQPNVVYTVGIEFECTHLHTCFQSTLPWDHRHRQSPWQASSCH